jgi:acetyl esterase
MLDPQAAHALQLLAAHNAQAGANPSPKRLRELYQARRRFTEPTAEAVSLSRDHRIDRGDGMILLRELRPAQASADEVLPALIYLHGGGWVVGSIDTHDVICRALANASGCAVMSVDYRLSPEHRFPTALEDTLAAHAWVVDQARALRIDPTRLAFGGDSAGGNLAAVACLSLRGQAHAPAFQLLVYPATSVRTDTPSYQTNGEGYGLTRAGMAAYIAAYLGSHDPGEDWRASPIKAPSLKGLPPALVITAGFDPLRDDGRLYADALSSAGVPTQYLCFERQIHGFLGLGQLISETRTALDVSGAALRRALA